MGFRSAPLMTARVENAAGVPVPPILEALNRMPGVHAVAAGTSVPLSAYGPRQRVASDAAGSNAIVVERATISTEFFSALDVPMRAGRSFSRQDSPATHTAIVNETLARQLTPGRDPIGSRVWIDQTAFDIVGVVADYSGNPIQPPDFAAKVFLPLALESKELKRVQFLVRTTGDPASLVQTMRREIRDAAPSNVVTNTYTLDQILIVMGQEMLVGTAPLMPLIAIGMLLTTAGIYGVLAFAVTRRSRELAVRVAVGASRRDLIRLVVAHSLRLIAAGCALGIGVTFGLSRIVRAGGGAGSIYDPAWPSFAIPVLIVLVIGALATWIPSRRALRINPAVLLRTS
jgi:ABC-type antimicrobial peptide transport system permease subunit